MPPTLNFQNLVDSDSFITELSGLIDQENPGLIKPSAIVESQSYWLEFHQFIKCW